MEDEPALQLCLSRVLLASVHVNTAFEFSITGINNDCTNDITDRKIIKAEILSI